MAAQTSDAEFAVHAAYYHRFMLGVKWFAIHFAALAAFLTLWFATSAGFLTALIVGVAIFAVGVFAMTHGMAHSSESESQSEPGSGHGTA
ncbi:MAG TPA: hypothetical protein VGL73_13305 [Caulobacteraceae bacterium]|jgi:hypothetical protein